MQARRAQVHQNFLVEHLSSGDPTVADHLRTYSEPFFHGGFTHADAKPGAIPGVAYHEQADALSFTAARDFLARAFSSTR